MLCFILATIGCWFLCVCVVFFPPILFLTHPSLLHSISLHCISLLAWVLSVATTWFHSAFSPFSSVSICKTWINCAFILLSTSLRLNRLKYCFGSALIPRHILTYLYIILRIIYFLLLRLTNADSCLSTFSFFSFCPLNTFFTEIGKRRILRFTRLDTWFPLQKNNSLI